MCAGGAMVGAVSGCGGAGAGGAGGTGGAAAVAGGMDGGAGQDGSPMKADHPSSTGTAGADGGGADTKADGQLAGVLETHQLFVNGMLAIQATNDERVLSAALHGYVMNGGSGKFVYFAMANYAGSDTFVLGTGYGAGTPTRRVQVEMVQHPIADDDDDGAGAGQLMGGDIFPLTGGSDALSGNGRYVVYETDGTANTVRVYDRLLGTSKIASLDAFGDPSDARWADISPGGRYIAYGSGWGVCVLDQKDDVRVCLRSAKVFVQTSEAPHITANGRYVVFSTGDDAFGGTGIMVIAVWDVQAGTLTNLTPNATAASTTPDISADGRYVAFASRASLEPADSNTKSDVYLLDRAQNKLTRILNNGAEWKSGAYRPSMAPSGKTLVFTGSVNSIVGTHDYAYSYDVATGNVSPVLVQLSPGSPADQFDIFPVKLSADDKWMAFGFLSVEVGAATKYYRMNLETGACERAPTDTARNQNIDITDDGRYMMCTTENDGMFRVVRFATP
jgi:Tol biopolymer transport system component